MIKATFLRQSRQFMKYKIGVYSMTIMKSLLPWTLLTLSLAACSPGTPEQTPPNQFSIASHPVQTLVPSQTEAETAVTEPEPLLQDPVTLYELDAAQFKKKTTQIPRYESGEISYWDDADVKSFTEGHHVTWSDPLITALWGIGNLIPYDYSKDTSLNKQLGSIQGETLDQTITLTTADGVTFTKEPYHTNTLSTNVIVAVPHLGMYTVTLQNGQNTDLQLIRKITFEEETTGNSEIQKPLVIFRLSDSLLSRKATEIPYYAFGELTFITHNEIESVKEGHSPWKATPLMAAEILTANLIPAGINKSDVTYTIAEVSQEGTPNETTVVEMKVPDVGVYNITLKYAGNSVISFITQIDFTPANVPVR